MRDPYEILDLKKGASRDEIKRAYKKLAKQYHPDQYDNNPLKDLAEERMREVNEAYDYLMKNTYDSNNNNSHSESSYSNTSTNNSSYSHNRNNNSTSSVNYQSIRVDINNGKLRAAEQKLNSIRTRDAEWNYLMGMLFMKKGWYDSARNYITTAYNINPSNMEYRNAFNQLAHQNRAYRQNYYGRQGKDNDMCDLCIKLWCADSLCECMGGDLISCF